MIALAPVALVGMVVFVTLGGLLVRALWNWLLPPLFGWHMVTFWQALGLLALCRILFGGLGLHDRAGHRSRERMARGWQRMSPGERERVREGMRARWGFGPPGPEPEGEAP
jgi:hypothetical protein